MTTQLITLTTLLSYAATCVRLITYQRGLSRYKFTMSLAAYFLILFTGTSALNIVFYPTPIYPGTAGVALTLCLLVWRARGNVASLLRGYA